MTKEKKLNLREIMLMRCTTETETLTFLGPRIWEIIIIIVIIIIIKTTTTT